MKKEFVGKERNQFGFDYYEVSSPTKWNYGILSATIEDLEKKQSSDNRPGQAILRLFLECEKRSYTDQAKGERDDFLENI